MDVRASLESFLAGLTDEERTLMRAVMEEQEEEEMNKNKYDENDSFVDGLKLNESELEAIRNVDLYSIPASSKPEQQQQQRSALPVRSIQSSPVRASSSSSSSLSSTPARPRYEPASVSSSLNSSRININDVARPEELNEIERRIRELLDRIAVATQEREEEEEAEDEAPYSPSRYYEDPQEPQDDDIHSQISEHDPRQLAFEEQIPEEDEEAQEQIHVHNHSNNQPQQGQKQQQSLLQSPQQDAIEKQHILRLREKALSPVSKISPTMSAFSQFESLSKEQLLALVSEKEHKIAKLEANALVASQMHSPAISSSASGSATSSTSASLFENPPKRPPPPPSLQQQQQHYSSVASFSADDTELELERAKVVELTKKLQDQKLIFEESLEAAQEMCEEALTEADSYHQEKESLRLELEAARAERDALLQQVEEEKRAALEARLEEKRAREALASEKALVGLALQKLQKRNMSLSPIQSSHSSLSPASPAYHHLSASSATTAAAAALASSSVSPLVSSSLISSSPSPASSSSASLSLSASFSQPSRFINHSSINRSAEEKKKTRNVHMAPSASGADVSLYSSNSQVPLSTIRKGDKSIRRLSGGSTTFGDVTFNPFNDSQFISSNPFNDSQFGHHVLEDALADD